MAATGNSQAERISRWDSLISNPEPEIADLPQLAEELAALKAHARPRPATSSTSRTTSAPRPATLNDRPGCRSSAGDKLRRRMGAALHVKFGFTSEQLVKFGFKPRRVPIRRRPPQTPEAPTAPPAGPKSLRP